MASTLTKREQAKIERTDANTGTRSSSRFRMACDLAETADTTRQASKFRRGFGKAWQAAAHMSDERIREAIDAREAAKKAA